MKDKEYEIRLAVYAELICPNPMEYAKNTRTYEQMKFEYELLHADKFTEEDLVTGILNAIR